MLSGSEPGFWGNGDEWVCVAERIIFSTGIFVAIFIRFFVIVHVKSASPLTSTVNKSAVYLSGNNLLIQTRSKTPEAFQNTFVRWQKERAWEIFNELFEECWIHFSKYYPNHKKPFLSLRTIKTRWGSLSKKTDLQPAKVTLNTLLICSSNNCIKQVIYHELCHLIHPNHRKGFYEIFGFFVPDWKTLKKELSSALKNLEFELD